MAASSTAAQDQAVQPQDQESPADTAAAPIEQTTPGEPESQGGDVEELYVTGSRIKRIDLTTPAPVTVLSRQDLDASGLQSVGEILQNLPAQSNAINIQYNNGGDGSTRVNIRGIGSERTLVLVNGRRFVPGGVGADGSVDLNSIPTEIIDRVEVLKDGASAIYGSDAVGGVVNIITKKNYSGVELSTYMGGTSNGGFNYNLGVTGGERSEKGGFLLSFSYFDQTDILAGQREFSKQDQLVVWGKELGIRTEGSSSTPEGVITDYGEDTGNAAWNALVAQTEDAGRYYLDADPNRGWQAFSGAGNSDTGGGNLYNYQPENYLVTPSQRIHVWGQGDYEISKRMRAYFEASYTNRRSEQLLAPEPLFTIQEGLAVSEDNLYNPFGRDFIDVRRRLVEFGNRIFGQDINTYRAVLGLDGTLTDEGFFSSWSWDANFIYGRTQGTDSKSGNLVRSRLAAAIGPSFVDSDGIARCGTPDAPLSPTGSGATDECTPINLFGGPGSITPEQVQRLTYTGVARGHSDQRMVNVTLNGELFEIWKRPVGLAIGYSYRRETGEYQPDPLTASGDTTGNKTNPTGGGYTENAGFAELSIPILADLPAVQLLEAQAAVRFFNFDTFGSDATYKIGGRWQVFEHLAVRGTYSTAFRAPNITELYQGQSDDFPAVTDPCSTADGRVRTETQNRNCTEDNVPAALPNTPSQELARAGGSATLDPETANILTAGVVVTPKGNKFIDGLSLTLDYFLVKVDNAIQRKGADIILNNCYSKDVRTDCENVLRRPTGYIDRIIDVNTNVGGNETAGIDFGVLYNLPTDVGTWRLNFDGIILSKFDDIRIDSEGNRKVVKGKGVYDLTAVYPGLRFNAGVSWGWEGLLAGVQGRYFGAIKECDLNDCSEDARTAFATAQAMLPPEEQLPFPERDVSANFTADIYAGYSFSTSLGYSSIQAGINNVFNSDPPRIYNGFLANSDAATYDYLGRYFYVGLRHQL
jgi:outer membrane receptor protein involved in Fe transport